MALLKPVLALLGAAVIGAAVTTLAMPRPVPPRVCCRARLPDRGDTIRFGTICADVVPGDTIGVMRTTR